MTKNEIHEKAQREWNASGKHPSADPNCKICKGVGRLQTEPDFIGNGDYACECVFKKFDSLYKEAEG